MQHQATSEFNQTQTRIKLKSQRGRWGPLGPSSRQGGIRVWRPDRRSL